MEDNVEVAGCSAAKTCLAIARRAQPRGGIHPGGNPQGDLGSALAPAGAAAVFAGLLDNAPRALAMWTGLRDAENAA